jgi:hypothetical protein
MSTEAAGENKTLSHRFSQILSDKTDKPGIDIDSKTN